MAKKKKSAAKKARTEHRFEPRPTANRWIVYACGVVGATAMGAGTWGQFGPAITSSGADPFKYAPWILAGGAVLVGIAIWFGTSGEPAIRVGDPGIAVEKGELLRIPWYAVERVDLEGTTVTVVGKDELGRDLVVRARVPSHPQAAAWIVREARARVPGVVKVPDDVAGLPAAEDGAGDLLTAEPVQVVGKHCVESGKVIAYEPDARICSRCERVYHKAHVPLKCACGSSLAGFRSQKKADEADDAALADAVAAADDSGKAPEPPEPAPTAALEPADKPQV